MSEDTPLLFFVCGFLCGVYAMFTNNAIVALTGLGLAAIGFALISL